ncbi:MAG: antitoxin [Acidimicrobiales bacterium]
MRTTVDLPEDIHRAVRSLAHYRNQSFSKTLGDLVRAALRSTGNAEAAAFDPATLLPVVRLGKPVTTEMVRTILDER